MMKKVDPLSKFYIGDQPLGPVAIFFIFLLFFVAVVCLSFIVWFLFDPYKAKQFIVRLNLVSESISMKYLGTKDPLLGLPPVTGGMDLSRLREDRAFREYVEQACKDHGVAADVIWAMISVERGLRLEKRFRKDSVGLMQQRSESAKRYNVLDPQNPYQSVRGAIQEVRFLTEEFRGDLRNILAAYVVGVDEVRKFGGMPPFPEVVDYVSRVMEEYRIEKAGEEILGAGGAKPE